MRRILLVWTNPEDPLAKLIQVACRGTTEEMRALLDLRRRRYPRLVPAEGYLASELPQNESGELGP